ncbi:hypothetical protein BFP71_02595 [Roseivirga misakiensis]|uniref:Uncharacterized protein n=1 Tax=Roseivirga misakiensis TaxID=1563681 RepID=A0A1E5T5C8_9BACT|nr:hypothetical protein BFP71_02595 [Roseivirga misakiensis]
MSYNIIKTPYNTYHPLKYLLNPLISISAYKSDLSERKFVGRSTISWSTYMRDKKIKVSDDTSISEERLQIYAALCQTEITTLLNYKIEVKKSNKSGGYSVQQHFAAWKKYHRYFKY